MKEVYILEHIYLNDEIEEIKFIGVFSSSRNAQIVIDNLKNLRGFNKHLDDCFEIHKCILNNYEWKDGFIDYEEVRSTR